MSDRELLNVGPNGRDHPAGIFGVISRVMRNRHLIRIALIIAVALGVTAGVRILCLLQLSRYF